MEPWPKAPEPVNVKGSVCDVSNGAAMEKVNDPVAPA